MKLIAVMMLAACLSHGQNVTPSDFAPLGRIGMGQWSPLRFGPVAWYQAEDNALDSAGSNNGAWGGTAAYASGKVGRAFDFDGASFVSIGNISPPGYYTISAWIKPESLPEGGGMKMIASKWSGAIGGQTYSVYLDSSGRVGFRYRNPDNDDRQMTRQGGPLGQWTHIAAVLGEYQAIYINGVASNPVYRGDTGAIQHTVNARIGAFNFVWSAYNERFDGQIDDVLIFDRALSAAEIKRLYDESTKRNGRAWK